MDEEWLNTRLPVRRVDAVPDVAARLRGDSTGDGEAAEPGWWEGIPAVRQLLLEGLDLGPATVFVGENGSGKSTLVEG